MLKDKLDQLNTAFTTLKTKITQKLATQQKSLQETNQKLQESQHQLELTLKENSANEQVLATLLKEFQELGQELE